MSTFSIINKQKQKQKQQQQQQQNKYKKKKKKKNIRQIYQSRDKFWGFRIVFKTQAMLAH